MDVEIEMSLETNDGGANWAAQTSGTGVPVRSVHFVDAQRGWAAGEGGVIKTTTGGVH